MLLLCIDGKLSKQKPSIHAEQHYHDLIPQNPDHCVHYSTALIMWNNLCCEPVVRDQKSIFQLRSMAILIIKIKREQISTQKRHTLENKELDS